MRNVAQITTYPSIERRYGAKSMFTVSSALTVVRGSTHVTWSLHGQQVFTLLFATLHYLQSDPAADHGSMLYINTSTTPIARRDSGADALQSEPTQMPAIHTPPIAWAAVLVVNGIFRVRESAEFNDVDSQLHVRCCRARAT